MVKGGGRCDGKIISLIPIPFCIHTIQCKRHDCQYICQNRGPGPGGINFTGSYIFNIIPITDIEISDYEDELNVDSILNLSVTILPKDADIAAFILTMYWKGMLTGIAAAISGVLGILSVNEPSLQWIAIIGYFGFVAVVVWFIVYLKIAHKKYLHIK